MKKTKKQILAEHLSGKYVDANSVMRLSNSENLGVQVKTLDSEGNFVIKFSASDPWIKPSEWLHNYRVSVKERYEEAASVYRSLFPQEDSVTTEAEVESDKIKVVGSSNDARYQSLLSGFNLIPGARTYDKLTFGANLERAREHFDKLFESHPKWTGKSVFIECLLGREMLSCCNVSDDLLKYIDDKLEARKNSLNS